MSAAGRKLLFNFSKGEISLLNSGTKLRVYCVKAAEKKYGIPLPDIIQERLEKELSAINRNHYSHQYMIGAMIAEKSHEEGYPVLAGGTTGSAFVSYLCGMTRVNPLPPHYWCSRCHHFELIRMESHNSRIMGYDLPDKRCPKCETLLNGEGADIQPEIQMGKHLDGKQYFCLFAAEEIHPILTRFTEKSFGVEFGIRVLPELSMLVSLEKAAGVTLSQIKTNDRSVLGVFLQEGFSFLPGDPFDWKEYDCENAVFEANPQYFSELSRLWAMMNGIGSWRNNGASLLRNGKSIRDCISTRDDIMQELLKAGMDREKSFLVANHVRKGKPVTQEMKHAMSSAGIPDWYIESCEKMYYLNPRSLAVDKMLLYWELAYYRCCFPDAYLRILSEKNT